MENNAEVLLDTALDELACRIDEADNYLAYSANPFMDLVVLKDVYLAGLMSLRKHLFELYTKLGGEDVWNE